MTTLSEVEDLGKEVDGERRANLRRPTPQLFNVIKKARAAIFNGFKVSGSRVETLLGGGSRVPTNVSLLRVLAP